VTKVVFLLVPRLHLLDLAGPAQVFSTAADLGCDYALSYVAEREDVPTAQGVPVRAQLARRFPRHRGARRALRHRRAGGDLGAISRRRPGSASAP
jgi:transcriptional regulator GlxA family with amidase domain